MDCLARNLASGRVPLPGGLIHETETWRVEHCVGPLGVGTLVVKPKRHVTPISELTAPESRELGPVLQQSAAVLDDLLAPEQVYACLWSHAGGAPVHVHYVVQPVTRDLLERYGCHGPRLQASMSQTEPSPPAGAVEAFADRARGAQEAGVAGGMEGPPAERLGSKLVARLTGHPGRSLDDCSRSRSQPVRLPAPPGDRGAAPRASPISPASRSIAGDRAAMKIGMSGRGSRPERRNRVGHFWPCGGSSPRRIARTAAYLRAP